MDQGCQVEGGFIIVIRQLSSTDKSDRFSSQMPAAPLHMNLTVHLADNAATGSSKDDQELTKPLESSCKDGYLVVPNQAITVSTNT